MREKKGAVRLSPSFAGITLIRFYGYDLSPDYKRRDTPGTLQGQN